MSELEIETVASAMEVKHIQSLIALYEPKWPRTLGQNGLSRGHLQSQKLQQRGQNTGIVTRCTLGRERSAQGQVASVHTSAPLLLLVSFVGFEDARKLLFSSCCMHGKHMTPFLGKMLLATGSSLCKRKTCSKPKTRFEAKVNPVLKLGQEPGIFQQRLPSGHTCPRVHIRFGSLKFCLLCIIDSLIQSASLHQHAASHCHH